MKKTSIFIFFCVLLYHNNAAAQKKTSLKSDDIIKLRLMSDTLRELGAIVQLDTLTTDSTATRLESQASLDTLSEGWRSAAADKIVATMKRFMRVKGSVEYDLADVKSLSCMRAADGSFRLFTWQVFLNSTTYKYYGVMQFENGKSVFLQDKSATIKSPERKKLGATNWYGALYYNMHEYRSKGKKYYLLFGYEAIDHKRRSKIIEVLTLDGGNNITFGAPIFDMRTEEDKRREAEAAKQPKNKAFVVAKEPFHRFIMDYDKDAGVTLNFRPEMNMITFDHVVEMGGGRYIPDGDVDGLKLEGNKWALQERLFKQTQDEAPRPVPILDGSVKGVAPAGRMAMPVEALRKRTKPREAKP